MVDSETRLDNTVSGPGNYFTYNYTFVNYVSEQFDAKILEPNIRPMIVNTIKTHPDMKIFRENKITMHYTYKDKVGFVVMKIEIKPQEYAN